MTYSDYGLKAKNKNILEKALIKIGMLSITENGPTPTSGIDYHFIGQIETTPAVLDNEGNIVTPSVTTSDVYANIRIISDHELIPALLKAFPDTETPMVQDNLKASYAMNLRIPITAVWG